MAFLPPIPLIRKKILIKKLKKCNAFSEDKAKTLEEAGVINPNCFNKVNQKLIKQKVLVKTKDDKYYLNSKYFLKEIMMKKEKHRTLLFSILCAVGSAIVGLFANRLTELYGSILFCVGVILMVYSIIKLNK